MSYCRWSNDDYQCDVYAYDNLNGGVTIFVARNRSPISLDGLPEIRQGEDGWIDRLIERRQMVAERMAEVPHAPIGLSRDGQDYHVSHAEALPIMISLKEEGYNVPQYAIGALVDRVFPVAVERDQ